MSTRKLLRDLASRGVKYVYSDVAPHAVTQGFYTEQFVNPVKAALEATEEWPTKTDEEKKEAVDAIVGHWPDIGAMIDAVDEETKLPKLSDDVVFDNVQRMFQRVPGSLAILRSTDVKPPQKLEAIVKEMHTRMAAEVHIALALMRSPMPAQKTAGQAMLAMVQAFETFSKFPFEDLPTEMCDKLYRYIKAIAQIVCPPNPTPELVPAPVISDPPPKWGEV